MKRLYRHVLVVHKILLLMSVSLVASVWKRVRWHRRSLPNTQLFDIKQVEYTSDAILNLLNMSTPVWKWH